MILRLCTLFLALILASARLALAADTALPLTRDETGHVRVPVMVNGQGPFEFVLDTAASKTTLTQALVDELGLAPIEGMAVGGHGATGAAQFQFYRVESVSLAGLPVSGKVLPAVPVSALEGPVFYGILGADFLRSYAVGINPAAATLTLGDAAPATDGYAAVPMNELLHGLMTVTVESNGTEIAAVVDTGARFSILNEAARKALGLAAREDADSRTIHGASGREMDVPKVTVERLQAGDVVWTNRTLGASELPVFKVLGLADAPAMILGADLLLDSPIVVDYPNRRLLVRRP